MNEPRRESRDIVHRMQDQLGRVRANAETASASESVEPPVGAGGALDRLVRFEVAGGRVSEVPIPAFEDMRA